MINGLENMGGKMNVDIFTIHISSAQILSFFF